MIAGLFIRNYKCYKGARFIPFITENLINLKAFIGYNGTGKSSILEAIDTFFNDREWTVHTDANKTDVSVGVLFLSKKEELSKRIGRIAIEYVEVISDAFWNVDISVNSNYSKYYKNFFELREKLKDYQSTHYLYMLGKEFDNKNLSFLTFKNLIETAIRDSESENVTIANLNKLRDEINNSISYLYIPVETSISEFLRLETKGMQDLMNLDIKKNIASRLNKKSIRVKGDKRDRQANLLDLINESLETFIQQVETNIQLIDTGYNFKKEHKTKYNLTANHVTDVIIDAYFSKRRLKKGQKSIINLSAGERKRALIDIAYAFLSENRNNKKQIILGIDEPESSLHISLCYEQFNRIEKIASEFNKQILITTHWYGALPVLKEGILHHIEMNDDDPKISSFELSNYFENRKLHPDDIQLKSFFDLSSSIISSLRIQESNWILVEGNEDKKYIEYYLSDEQCKVIPLGGCSIVKTIYEYLYLPISQKSETRELNGKIFCLIDTDTNGMKLDIPSESKDNRLRIRRLQFKQDEEEIKLMKLDSQYKSPTEIEECLAPKQFYQALKESIDKFGQNGVNEAFEAFEFDDNVKTSFIKNDYSILNHKGEGRIIREDKELILKFIDENKGKIADSYISMEKEEVPKWITEIKDFFNN